MDTGRLVIWQSQKDQVRKGFTHRIVQIDVGDCLVEFCHGESSPTSGWYIENEDDDCARAYCQALLQARNFLREQSGNRRVLRGIVFEIWINSQGVPTCLSTPENIRSLEDSLVEEGDTPFLSFVAENWEGATAYYKQLQQECWNA